jgi:hypothetical protein
VGVDAQRFREQLIRGLSDDGLEELTLRLARKEHRDAHRTGRGRDGGIDILSDYERPPARGWQAKTSTKGTADWDKCRASIKAAMAGDTPPKHYTFVFNHPLSEPQRNFWRDKLLPELRAEYPDLEALDYWDDLAWKVEGHPEIVDWLIDGALATYVRTTLAQTAATGVNPLANAVDLADGLGGVAEHAQEVGRGDPRFAYGEAGREVDAGDRGLVDRRAHFSMSAGQRDALPSFKVAIREGDRVQEITARPREGVEVRAPEPWFADNPEGELARALARASLARGRSIVLTGSHVGLSGGDVPDRFGDWFDATQRTGPGELELGVSEPLELTVTLALPDVGEVPETVRIHRVPAESGADIAYAGAVGGAILAIDVFPSAQKSAEGEGQWVECTFNVTLAVHGEPARDALRGLGFAQAFGAAEHLHFACPGLLPPDGYDVHGRLPLASEAAETWEVAAKVALALDGLQLRDGVERRMPDAVTARDVARAELILHLLQDDEVAVEVPPFTEFPAPLPPGAELDDDPSQWLTCVAELPPFMEQPTGLHVAQTVESATPLRIERTARGSLALICQADADGASIVMRTATRT